jgi:hypothetical protein
MSKYGPRRVNVKRQDVNAFIAEHGGIRICGDGPDGPTYTLTDGWILFVPVVGKVAKARPPQPEAR